MNLELLEAAPNDRPQGPPLLFVHGSNLAAWCWQEHFLPFFAAAGYHAFALSLRGHGRSEGAERLQSFTLDDFTADVLDAVGRIDGEPVLVGHSMGGAIAQRIMREQPDAIAGLALLASVPPAGLGADTARLMVGSSSEMLAMREFNLGRADRFPARLYLSDKLPDAERDALAARLQPESDKAGYALTGRLVRGRPVPGRPVLVMGGQADRIVSPQSVRATAKAYRTEPAIFAGTSHLAMLDPNWRQVAECLLGFLRDVPVAQAVGEGR